MDFDRTWRYRYSSSRQHILGFQPDKKAIVEGPPADPEKVLPPEEKGKFIAGKDDGIQSGFCVMDNGMGYVANATFIPGGRLNV